MFLERLKEIVAIYLVVACTVSMLVLLFASWKASRPQRTADATDRAGADEGAVARHAGSNSL